MIKLVPILLEIGEKISSYPIKSRIEGTTFTKYTWEVNLDEEDISNQTTLTYTLYIIKPENEEYFVDFGILKPEGIDFKSTNKEYKRGNLFKVMSTVVECIDNELKIDKKQGTNIQKITIDTDDSKRINLYLAYIKNNAPVGSNVISSQDKIEITLPK